MEVVMESTLLRFCYLDMRDGSLRKEAANTSADALDLLRESKGE